MKDSPELQAARAAVSDGNGSGTTTGIRAAVPAESPGGPRTDLTPYVPPPGTPGALAEVQAARAEAEAARRALEVEVAALKASGRRALDPRLQLASIPDRIRSDPRRAAMLAGAVVGTFAVVRGVRRLRRAKPPTFLPPEVEAVLGPLGSDADAVREALNRGFTKYLEEHGARGPLGRLPRSTVFLLVPVVNLLVREAVRRMARDYVDDVRDARRGMGRSGGTRR